MMVLPRMNIAVSFLETESILAKCLKWYSITSFLSSSTIWQDHWDIHTTVGLRFIASGSLSDLGNCYHFAMSLGHFIFPLRHLIYVDFTL